MPARRKPSFTDQIGSEDVRVALAALRDRLAAELELAEGRDVAPLAKQLQDVLKHLAAMPVEKKGSIADDLAQRRKRRAGSVPSDGADAAPGRQSSGRRRVAGRKSGADT